MCVCVCVCLLAKQRYVDGHVGVLERNSRQKGDFSIHATILCKSTKRFRECSPSFIVPDAH